MSRCPLVSVVIPVRNRLDELMRSVQSARQQTLADIEIIIVENNSDDPAQVDRKMNALNDRRIRVTHCDPCANANVARNMGATISNGDYVAYLDSDDEWEPWHLERAVAALDAAGADFFYGGLAVDNGSAVQTHDAFDLDGVDPGDYLFGRVRGWAPTPSFVMRRRVLGLIRWDESLRRHQDFDFFIRVCREFKSVASPGPVCRVHWPKGEERSYCRESMIVFYKKHAGGMSRRARSRFSYGKIKLGIKRCDLRLVAYFIGELVRQ